MHQLGGRRIADGNSQSLSAIVKKWRIDSGIRRAAWITVGPTGSGISAHTNDMDKLTKDKENIDKITELIANQEPVKEWVCIYWMAVAIGHILEWMVKHETGRH